MDEAVSLPSFAVPRLRAAYDEGLSAHRVDGLPFEVFGRCVLVRVHRRLERAGIRASRRTLKRVLDALPGADLYLAIACDEGLAGAVEALASAYVPRLRTIARGLGASEAEPMVRDLLADVAAPGSAGAGRTKLGAYEGAGTLLAWLSVTLRRRLIDEARTCACQQRAQAEHAKLRGTEDVLGPVEAVQNRETVDRLGRTIRAAWSELQPVERTVLVLRYRDGLTQRGVARVLGRSESRISRLLRSTVRRLRNELLPHFEGEDVGSWDVRGSLWPLLVEAVSRHLSDPAATPAASVLQPEKHRD